MWRPLGLLLLCLAASGAVSCSNDGRACYPGDYRRCSCEAGDEGYQQCDVDDGSEYGACDCSGTIPGLTTAAATGGSAGSGGGMGGSTSSSSGGAAGGGGKLPFLASCMTDDECETGLCYNYPSKGPHCTKSCTSDAECPAPSPGCNPKGICKLQ